MWAHHLFFPSMSLKDGCAQRTDALRGQNQCCGSEIRCLFDPWIGDPGSGMGKKSGSGFRIRDPDLKKQPGSYLRELRNHFLELKYLNSLMRIRDPGWKKFGSEIRDGKNSDPGSGMEKIRIRDSGSGINIPDPQHWSKPNS